MRILIIHSTPWNDKVSGNNVLSNWFEDMNAEFANIYRGAGAPDNKCCSIYFQLTDSMMVKSLRGGAKAGRSFIYSPGSSNFETEMGIENYRGGILSRIELFRFARSLVWCIGRIDKQKLSDFIEEFNPDVVFTCRKASLATLRIERIVHNMTSAPFVAFTGDDEYSLRQFRFSPWFWLERMMTRNALRKNAKFYCHYYTLSEDQAKEYSKIFKIDTSVLRKCAIPNNACSEMHVHSPIRIVYAGKLYCNRWKTLSALSKCITRINSNQGKKVFEMDIYAVGEVSAKEKNAIEICDEIRIHPPVRATELSDIFRKTDIVLHVESFDIVNRLDTRYSFSTKIIDYLASGCAIMAICWTEQTGYKYLKSQNAAICIPSINNIYETLFKIMNNRSIIEEYKSNARMCLNNNHCKNKVQAEILQLFENTKATKICE